MLAKWPNGTDEPRISVRWRSGTDHPTESELTENSEFIVVIKGADNPTTLLYNDDDGEWCDEEGNAYLVDWWIPMPVLPKEKKS